MLVMLFVGSLLAIEVSGESVSGRPAHIATTPQGLFTDLTSLDQKLDALIRDEKKGKGLAFEDLIRLIKDLQREKHNMVSTYFNQDIYGVKAQDVILDVDCIDYELGLAYGVALEANEHYLPSKITDHIHHFFETAKKCKEALETGLRGAGSAPPGLRNDLASLDQKLRVLIRDEKKGKGLAFEDLIRLIKDLQREKISMVSTYFNQDIYGVKAQVVILSVDVIDYELGLAYGVALEANEHYLPSKIRDHIHHFFETAKKLKQRLETELSNAVAGPTGPTGPTTTLTTTVGTPTVSGGGGT